MICFWKLFYLSFQKYTSAKINLHFFCAIALFHRFFSLWKFIIPLLHLFKISIFSILQIKIFFYRIQIVEKITYIVLFMNGFCKCVFVHMWFLKIFKKNFAITSRARTNVLVLFIFHIVQVRFSQKRTKMRVQTQTRLKH